MHEPRQVRKCETRHASTYTIMGLSSIELGATAVAVTECPELPRITMDDDRDMKSANRGSWIALDLQGAQITVCYLPPHVRSNARLTSLQKDHLQ